MTMNANNTITDFRTHWVNTKTLAEILETLREAKRTLSVLYDNAKEQKQLSLELMNAFYCVQDACIHMSKAQKENIIKSEED